VDYRTLANSHEQSLIFRRSTTSLQDQIKINGQFQCKCLSCPITTFLISYGQRFERFSTWAKGLKRFTPASSAPKADVDPASLLIGSASGLGGTTDKDAQYYNIEPNLPLGKYDTDGQGCTGEVVFGRSAYTTRSGYSRKIT